MRIRRLSWQREAVLIAGFYFVYQIVRSNLGEPSDIATRAFNNAQSVIHFEQRLRLFTEERIQQFFYPAHWFIKILNVYYGTLHFIVTIGVLIWLFAKHKDRYRFWRNTLAITTSLALIGFALFPLEPPRMLPGFQDTLSSIGGLWSFQSPTAKALANQYAAMPSLHFAWSLWCALAIFTLTRKKWVKALALFYPAVTALDIIVTANHYWLDAIFGALLVVVAISFNRIIERRRTVKFDAALELAIAGAPAKQLHVKHQSSDGSNP
jgi:membrane-associated phospholipid phosphatase